ncbi:MAG TPA: XdhC family protein [Pirellulaceae bacterium]|jgi:xanthine dehydrogenase accessory factor
MREVLRELVAAMNAGRAVAWCRLVETRGSTPQKAGAAMLVREDGSQAGTLGGGCVEAEVKRRALGLLAENRSEVCTFQLDSDYGWDDGLICGGRMKILVEPIAAGSHNAYFERLAAFVERGEGCTEALVFDDEASGLAAPDGMLFDGDGKLVARLRNIKDEEANRGARNATEGVPYSAVIDALRPLADRPRAYAARGVAYLPVLQRCRLVIVGGGHVGKAVGELAADLDFDVWVVDDRPEYVAEERFPRAERRISGPIERVLPDLEITSDTYCLIVTRGHSHDQEALFHLANRGARYVGLIGSRRKIKMIFENLAAEGVSREALAKVYAPLGIDIGSQTVPEIAVSICAELIAHRNLGHIPGRAAAIEF